MNTKAIDLKQAVYYGSEEHQPIPDTALHYDTKEPDTFYNKFLSDHQNLSDRSDRSDSAETSTDSHSDAIQIDGTDTFAIDVFPDDLKEVVKKLADKAEVGLLTATNCVLGSLSLASQSVFNCRMVRTGQEKPVSMFYLTIAVSGERKSTSMTPLLHPFEKYRKEGEVELKEMIAEYRAKKDVWEQELHAVRNDKKIKAQEKTCKLKEIYAREPVAPISFDPIAKGKGSIEGVLRRLKKQLSVGLLTSEGAGFFGGHGMKVEGGAQNRSLSVFCEVWDGERIDQTKAKEEESFFIEDGRISLHVMIQPEAYTRLVDVRYLYEQGFFARVLKARAFPRAFTRVPTDEEEENVCEHGIIQGILDIPEIKRFNEVIYRLLKLTPAVTVSNDSPSFNIIEITDKEAKRAWFKAYREIEVNRKYKAIKPLADKAGEMIIRLACQIAIYRAMKEVTFPDNTFFALPMKKPQEVEGLFDKEPLPIDPYVTKEDVKAAHDLMIFYLGEALKDEVGETEPARKDAIFMAQWMLKKGKATLHNKDFASLNKMTADRAYKAIDILLAEDIFKGDHYNEDLKKHTSWIMIENKDEVNAWIKKNSAGGE